ncbi:MAG: glycosyltransferase [candidate division KSB1 bacterium]|nr:glycosyltransferase [candidate division KSB1 bacterium]MDZ7365705.1 glycosyltransferase [candidate division KSB1 bacterium]MDZ7403219.1 glycosyltransferase [candidate division KSB1 bacterium]
MRILYLAPSFQHPAMRGPTRCYHFIKEMAKRHQITLMALTNCEVAEAPLREMAGYTERVELFSSNGAADSLAAAVAGRLPVIGKRLKRLLQHRAGVNKMKKAFTSLAGKDAYDVVLFHGKSIFPVIADWNDSRLVVDFCDATSMRYQSKMSYAGPAKRLLYALRYWQIKRIEQKLIAKTPQVAFVSWRDREAVLGASNRGRVVPIGVDHQFWRRRSETAPRPNCLVFTGVMNYAPNEDAALYLLDKILPIVRRSIPNVEALIVGRDPTPALKALANQFTGVTVTGFVDDVRTYLERAAVFVAPLRYGSGVQNKVLEAMAMEVPVITTSLAAAGLRVDGAGEPPVIVADGEEKFAAAIVTLLGQKEERARLAIEGRRFVEKHFVWPRSAAKLEEMCLAAAHNGKVNK